MRRQGVSFASPRSLAQGLWRTPCGWHLVCYYRAWAAADSTRQHGEEIAVTTSILVVLTNPVEGKEDEYNRWYSDVHVREVVGIPGFISAQRFALTDAQMGAAGDHKYLAIYEVEGDPGAALEALKAARPDLQMSDALDLSTTSARMFAPITDKVTEGMKG